ncbi:MAG: chemotaxis protein CheW [Pirellulaceae bacterium]|nr:chemotaxis protein CheW [Pirellulaceae bacterium]
MNALLTQPEIKKKSNAYLVFQLDSSDYAIAVEHVSEIITSLQCSPVPGSPDFLIGVANLRGRILPMIDLRTRFRFEQKESERQCFMILTLESEEEALELGLKIDSVSEVARIAPEQIDPAPSMSKFMDRLVFSGVAKINSGVKLIVDARSLVDQLKDAITIAYSDQPTKA